MESIEIRVDVGGSHDSSAACNLEERKFLPETHFENELINEGTADEILSIWSKTIADCIKKVIHFKVNGIGFAMPVPFDYVKGIPLFKSENRKYENIYGINIPKLLRKLLYIYNNFPIRFLTMQQRLQLVRIG